MNHPVIEEAITEFSDAKFTEAENRAEDIPYYSEDGIDLLRWISLYNERHSDIKYSPLDASSGMLADLYPLCKMMHPLKGGNFIIIFLHLLK